MTESRRQLFTVSPSLVAHADAMKAEPLESTFGINYSGISFDPRHIVPAKAECVMEGGKIVSIKVP